MGHKQWLSTICRQFRARRHDQPPGRTLLPCRRLHSIPAGHLIRRIRISRCESQTLVQRAADRHDYLLFDHGILVNGTKYFVDEKRPDSSAQNSFPSGHTATVFMGAELVRSEYGIGYGIGAYLVAGGVAFLRLYNDRHWLNDVVAGAGFGILSARIGYWLLPVNRKLFRLDKKKSATVIATSPFYQPDNHAFGAALAIRF